MKRDWLILVLWILIFILIRSAHFSAGLNFSQDQASDSLYGMNLLRNHKITLIGTETGYSFHGRLLFLGPLFIYTYMAYNVLGHFDPVISSYLFMLTGALSIVPLYFGVKRLANHYVAMLVVILYAMLPYFIDYTKFMWNPNFQLILTPVLIYLFSRYYEHKSLRWLLATGVFAGALLQYHYQYAVVIVALGIFLTLQKRKSKSILTFVMGLIIGFAPVILFEFRHNFYNIQTIILYCQHYREVFFKSDSSPVSAHFFLSITLISVGVFFISLKKYVNATTLIIVVVLLLPFSMRYLMKPDRMFNSTIQWTLADEQKVYSIIKNYNLTLTNISHLDYDNTAIVQKYFLTRDNKAYFSEYRTNKYLFAISKTNRLSSYRAYEITSFSPRIIVKSWPISPLYTLYLLERTEKQL